MINIYAPKKRISKYMKTKTEGEIDKSTIILENFNISLLGINRPNKNPVRIQKTQSIQLTKVP